MKVLQVLHGYPMRYNAGSEVYTQGLAQVLAERHEVHVFTRQENSFLPEYATQRETDLSDPRISLHVINMARARDGYRHTAVDAAFAHLLDEIRPGVVHIGHLNHLSTSLVFKAKERRIPVAFTLHDYWLMCPRGQFIQMYPQEPSEVWPVCDGQDDRKCAVRCYVRYFSGNEEEYEADAAYWTGWVGRRMRHVREVCDAVGMFIAPSRYLLRRFRDDFGIPDRKLTYLDYGFHRKRMEGRSRTKDEPFTFGYIGTHIPAKGVNHLIESFGGVSGKMLGEFETCGMRRRERRALEKRWRVERRRRVPSESAVFRYLERFHDVDEESKREAHRAFIAAPNKALEGLGKVNADVVGFVQSRSPHTEATLDMDATLVETRKQEALYSYKKYRAYQPLITYWSTFKEYGRTLEKIRVGGETLTRSRRRSRRCWWRSTRGRATPWDRTPG